MKFTALALAAAVNASEEARDPKFSPVATSIDDLHVLKPEFVYPNKDELGAKSNEKKSKKKITVDKPKYVFDPAMYAPQFVLPTWYPTYGPEAPPAHGPDYTYPRQTVLHNDPKVETEEKKEFNHPVQKYPGDLPVGTAYYIPHHGPCKVPPMPNYN